MITVMTSLTCSQGADPGIFNGGGGGQRCLVIVVYRKNFKASSKGGQLIIKLHAKLMPTQPIEVHPGS